MQLIWSQQHILFFSFSFCKNEVRNSAASSCRCGSPLVNLCTSQDLVFVGSIFVQLYLTDTPSHYREAADDPNSRASSQASRKDKEAGISAQFFSWWQFEEHKRREKEKVMALSFCVFFFCFLFVLILNFCGSCLSDA